MHRTAATSQVERGGERAADDGDEDGSQQSRTGDEKPQGEVHDSV